jgi:putative transposase
MALRESFGMINRFPLRFFKTSPEIIRVMVTLYIRFPLSLHNIDDLLDERGVEISHETVRYWWNWFSTIFASHIRKGLDGFVRVLTRN